MPLSQQWALIRVCSMFIVTSASSDGCGKIQSITASGSLKINNINYRHYTMNMVNSFEIFDYFIFFFKTSAMLYVMFLI